MTPGIFTISLDFELHWGVFDKEERSPRMERYQNTLRLIPDMLTLFEMAGVRATWATVGAVLASDAQDWEAVKPALEPQYSEPNYSAYKWASKNGLDAAWADAHFAPEAVKAIVQAGGQELGTHTFSHYYCMEPQTAPAAFSADLAAAKAISARFGVQPISLVFPRNQFNPFYLKACYEAGIRVVRSNTKNWFWTPIPDRGSNLVRKVFRTGDGYVPMGRRTSYPLHSIAVQPHVPLQVPASRLFRSWHNGNPVANNLRLRRMLGELTVAAQRNECYHLWWHPENFGVHPKENLSDLAIVLQHFDKLRRQYGMISWNMGDYARNLLD